MTHSMKMLGLLAGLLFGCMALAATGLEAEPRAAGENRAFTVRVTGTGSRTMILIPGLLSSGEVWDGAVEHFSARYRVHVLTIAGFAGVAPADGPLLPRVRDELIAYIRDENLDRPILVGHSLGGFLALWIASTAPDLVGPIVAVDGVPFLPALMDPSATASGMRPQAERMRTLYRSMTSEQLELQSHMSLSSMISDPANVARAAAWASQSDGRATGQAVYELMTTDIRDEVAKITSEVLVIAAAKAMASTSDRIDAVLKIYEAQVARVPHASVVLAKQALHFIMLDDAPYLLSTMDAFLARGR